MWDHKYQYTDLLKRQIVSCSNEGNVEGACQCLA